MPYWRRFLLVDGWVVVLLVLVIVLAFRGL
jgi:hypothetical protein